jgi:hypothetical protein
MQAQNGYVNGYVVIIFAHYIFSAEERGGWGKVTWASLFVPGSRGVALLWELASQLPHWICGA